MSLETVQDVTRNDWKQIQMTSSCCLIILNSCANDCDPFMDFTAFLC